MGKTYRGSEGKDRSRIRKDRDRKEKEEDEYPFMTRCDCGGAYVLVPGGMTLDSFPPYHQVKCFSCGNTTYAKKKEG